MEFLRSNPSEVCNTDLAAALCTLGIERDPEQPLKVLQGEINKTSFCFREASACKTYRMSEMVPAWDSHDLPTTHPRHAITYMRIGLRSRGKFLDYAKGDIKIGIKPRPGGQFEAIPLPAHIPAPQGPRLPRSASNGAPAPDAATTPRLQTDDIELACSLLACGIPLWRDFPIERNADRLSFFFMPGSPCGQFNTRALMIAWTDLSWHEQHPEHPFAYLQCVFENRRRLMREIRNKVPMATFVRAGFPHFLSLNADAKTEALFMHELKKL